VKAKIGIVGISYDALANFTKCRMMMVYKGKRLGKKRIMT